MKSILSQLIYLTIIILLGGYVAYQAWGNSLGYEFKTNQLTEQLDMQDNFKTVSKKVFEKITFSWYDGYSDHLDALNELKRDADKYRSAYYKYIRVFAVLLSLSFVIYLMLKTKHMLFCCLVLTCIALVVGLFAPVLAIVAYEDIPVLGQTVFQYDSKSILGAIEKLFLSQQYFIAVVISLFTVLLPVLKSALMAIVIYGRNMHFSTYTMRVMKEIGKWSMLDVFVIAIVVTYFTTKNAGRTDASLEPGVYFFTMYVIASMVISFFIYRRVER